MNRVALLGLVLLAVATGPARGAEPEPNDTLAGAPSISGGVALGDSAPSGVVTVDGTLASGDIDHFAFGVRADEAVTLALFEEDAGALHDAMLVVFDGAGTEIARSDDDGPGFFSRLALLPSRDETWTVAVQRPPYLSIYGDFAGAFAYALVVSAASAPVTDADLPPGSQGANDSPATAQPIGATAVVTGSLVPEDVDVYSFTAAAGDLITLSIFDAADGERNDSVMTLQHAGAPVASDDDAGAGLLSNLAHRVAAGEGGTWQVEVSGFRTPATVPHQERFDYVLVVGPVASGPPARQCDANRDGSIDRLDLDAIFAARNQPASGADDLRDADHDGTITVLDARRCSLVCDRAECAPPPACGLGAELIVVFAGLAGLARTRR